MRLVEVFPGPCLSSLFLQGTQVWFGVPQSALSGGQGHANAMGSGTACQQGFPNIEHELSQQKFPIPLARAPSSGYFSQKVIFLPT